MPWLPPPTIPIAPGRPRTFSSSSIRLPPSSTPVCLTAPSIFSIKAGCEYVGLPLEDLQGWKWTAAIHPDDVEGIVEVWRASLASGKPFLHEARVRRADGEYRWMLHHKVAIRDEHGNIVKWNGSSIDIEDRKRAEQELRRSEEYLAEAQKLSHTGSFAYVPAARKTVYWSEELFRIFGLDPQRGIPDYDETRRLVHPDDRDRVSESCLAGFRQKVEFSQDYRLLLHDGTLKHLQVIWRPVLDEAGDLVKYIGTAADVTDRKTAEEQVRRNAEELQRSEFYLAEGQRLATHGKLGLRCRRFQLLVSRIISDARTRSGEQAA